ncbi:MAG: AMP-binding protein, partial [Rubrivivax sp.]|nr:AMP-binding protein [Rubrivivax sp.]
MSGLWELATYEPRRDVLTPGDTLPTMFLNAVKARGDKVWMREKKLGIWRSWSWNQAATAVREVAMGLASLGLEPGQTASILSNTVVNWVLCDLGVQSAGGVCNGIYPTDSAAQVEYLCVDSATRVIFVEDEEQLDKVLEIRDRVAGLDWAIVFDMEGLSNFSDPRVLSLEALREKGRAYDQAHPGEFERRVASRGPQDLAILVYTSGTTGKPKGAMHLHGALTWTVRQATVALPQIEGDERMCFLPLCHVAERMIGEISSIYAGSILNFVENPDTVPENVREISPTIFFAVPRVWEKFYSAVVIGVKEATRLQQLAYGWGIGVGGRIADLVLAGKPVPGGLKLQFRIARFLALDNVRKLIGIHRARYLLTGAAPISPELIRWYLSLGVPMLEGWGMTETTGLGTFNRPDGIRPGTIGVPAEGVEARIDPATGEIQVRGRNVFAGYLNLPEKTAETISPEGWLHTGDVGVVDDKGYFRITDRMKDIIITAGGKNVTPSEWENELKFSPYITDAVVIGDKRPYLVCIVMIDQENVEKYAQDNDVPFSNYASLARAPEIVALIQGEVDKVNKKFARVEQVKK